MVKSGIDNGYRHIDTAQIYNTETPVGEAIAAKIKEGVVRRKDLFVTTKVGHSFNFNGIYKNIYFNHLFLCYKTINTNFKHILSFSWFYTKHCVYFKIINDLKSTILSFHNFENLSDIRL